MIAHGKLQAQSIDARRSAASLSFATPRETMRPTLRDGSLALVEVAASMAAHSAGNVVCLDTSTGQQVILNTHNHTSVIKAGEKPKNKYKETLYCSKVQYMLYPKALNSARVQYMLLKYICSPLRHPVHHH